MKGGLGAMPLTLWLIVAAIVLYFYLRRASLGIDTHPGEGKPVPVRPKAPSVFIGPLRPPELPQPGERGLSIQPLPGYQGGSILQ